MQKRLNHEDTFNLFPTCGVSQNVFTVINNNSNNDNLVALS